MAPAFLILRRCFVRLEGLFFFVRTNAWNKAVREWLARLGTQTLFIEPCSPWENDYIESFNGKLRDELLNGEIFNILHEARELVENVALQVGTGQR